MNTNLFSETAAPPLASSEPRGLFSETAPPPLAASEPDALRRKPASVGSYQRGAHRISRTDCRGVRCRGLVGAPSIVLSPARAVAPRGCRETRIRFRSHVFSVAQWSAGGHVLGKGPERRFQASPYPFVEAGGRLGRPGTVDGSRHAGRGFRLPASRPAFHTQDRGRGGSGARQGHL